MKKLMIAAVIVCTAAMSQAATCYWKASTAYNQQIYAGNTSTKYSGTAYLIWAGQSILVEGVSTSIDQQYIINHSGDVATIAGQIGKDLTVQGGGASTLGTIAMTDVWSDALNKTDAGGDPAVAQQRKYFLAIVKDDKVFVSANSANVNESFNTSGQLISMSLKSASQKSWTGSDFSAHGAGWYTAAPEPTSGLLLLLGVAGLALKRKRA